MQPSTAIADATATRTPDHQEPPCPENGLYRTWAALPSPSGADHTGFLPAGSGAKARPGLKGDGSRSNSPMSSEFRELMEEPAGGPNYGRRASDDPNGDGRRLLPLGIDEAQARDIVRNGGWVSYNTKEGSAVGMTAHRGVIHPDEFVDYEALVVGVEAELGFSFDDVHAVYRQGRLSEPQRELRGQIDARLLALSRSGANMTLLGRVLGFPTKPDEHGGSCRTVTNALARARTAELAAPTEGSD